MQSSSLSKLAAKIFLLVLFIGTGAAIALYVSLSRSGSGTGTGADSGSILETSSLFRLNLLPIPLDQPIPSGWSVEGSVQLEEGRTVRLEIAYADPNGEAFDSKKIRVAGGRISTEFGPYSAPLPSGDYTLRVRHSDHRVQEVASSVLGDAAAAAAEDRARRMHFLGVIQSTREVIALLQEATDSAREGKRFVDSTGKFMAEPWRRWLDEIFNADLRQIRASQQAYETSFAADSYPFASVQVIEIFDRVRSLSLFHSAQVHRRYGLPPRRAAEAIDGADLLRRLDALSGALRLTNLSASPEDLTETVEIEGARITRKTRGRSSVLRIDGSSPFPDACQYTVELRFHRPENSIIASHRGIGPQYWLRLGSLERSIPTGTYSLTTQMDYRSQPDSVRERIDREAPDLRQGRTTLRTFVLGTEAARAVEEAGRVDHYSYALQTAAGWFWGTRDRLEDASVGDAFVLDGGGLDVKALKVWGAEMDAEIRDLRDRHEAYRGATIAVKYESEGRSLSQLIQAIYGEKNKGMAAVLGRETGGGAFELPIKQAHLNMLIRNDICPGLGLPAVTLGSLRWGEAQKAAQAGRGERALEICLRLGRAQVKEKSVEGHALLMASEILIKAGKEWRALPVLKRLAEGKRYRGLRSAEEGTSRLEAIRASSEPWARPKQKAYRDEMAGLMEEIRERIDDGRLEAASHRIERRKIFDQGYREVFRSLLGESEIATEMDGIFSAARRLAGFYKLCETHLGGAGELVRSLRKDLDHGRVDRYQARMKSEFLPYLGSMESLQIPEAIVRRASRALPILKAEEKRLRKLRQILEDRGLKLFDVFGPDEALFQLTGSRMLRAVGLRPGGGGHDGIVLLEILQLDDGWLVVLRIDDQGTLPLFHSR
ncbi:MAG: hypothetical protein O7H41_07155 [Planctomycetota bacterium]|nr:hypothetical protein [Planctomycetota bacterium]